MVTRPPAWGRQAAMLGEGTSLNENEAAEADAVARPAEAVRAAAAAAATSPAAMRTGTRRHRTLILRMMVSRLDGGAVPGAAIAITVGGPLAVGLQPGCSGVAMAAVGSGVRPDSAARAGIPGAGPVLTWYRGGHEVLKLKNRNAGPLGAGAAVRGSRSGGGRARDLRRRVLLGRRGGLPPGQRGAADRCRLYRRTCAGPRLRARRQGPYGTRRSGRGVVRPGPGQLRRAAPDVLRLPSRCN